MTPDDALEAVRKAGWVAAADVLGAEIDRLQAENERLRAEVDAPVATTTATLELTTRATPEPYPPT